MPLSAGSRLGPYEILSPIGAGGMGEVYRASDTQLKRDVALKILPAAFARDPDRMARFQREAEVLASLNHPNIAAIYGLAEAEGVRALVMELVEGEAPRGPMPLDDASHVASQIAAALEYAHERGVMHRDLKPANVKVTPEGVVKLLDFGLAKAMSNQRESQISAGENSPTLTIGATEAGVILGTAAYMAPEQARGKSVDQRADIWAFGVVLHELLTGKQAFGGETVSDALASVIKEDPDWAALPATTPPAIQTLIRRCLTKDVKRRLQAIGEARIVLEDARTHQDASSLLAPSGGEVARPRWRWALPWAVAGGLAIALAVALVFQYRSPQTASKPPDVPLSPTAAPRVVPAPPAPAVSLPDKSVQANRSVATPEANQKEAARTPSSNPAKPAESLPKEDTLPPRPTVRPLVRATAVSSDAKAAYDEASRLLDQGKLSEAVLRFDAAIRASPDYIDALAGRATARRNLGQYELSIADCNQIIRIESDEPRGYNCRGFTYVRLEQYERALSDLNQAIRINPNFAFAYDSRGSAYVGLQQYEQAVQDFSQAIRLRPRDGQFYSRRATAYRSLKQFDKAIQDYTEAIRLQPNNANAYRGRAAAEDALGDAAGATADRDHAQTSLKKK